MGFIVVTISFLKFKVPAALDDYLVGAATGRQSAGIVAPILQRAETEADIPCAKISVGSAIFRRASCDGFHASTWQRPHSALVGQALDDVYWA
jgi:hypothetical protein